MGRLSRMMIREEFWKEAAIHLEREQNNKQSQESQ
jgi:hypothetical protein